jgi:hypothetical protein
MPNFDQITKFIQEIGMPWAMAAGLAWMHYRTLHEISGLQQKMCANLELICKHIIEERSSD